MKCVSLTQLIRREDCNCFVVLVAARGMGSSGSGTMQGFGNTAFTSGSKYATVLMHVLQ